MNYLPSRNHNSIFTQYFGALLPNVFSIAALIKNINTISFTQLSYFLQIQHYTICRRQLGRSQWHGIHRHDWHVSEAREYAIPIHLLKFSCTCIRSQAFNFDTMLYLYVLNMLNNFVLGGRCSIIRHDNHLRQVHGSALQHTIRLRQSHICDPKAIDEG